MSDRSQYIQKTNSYGNYQHVSPVNKLCWSAERSTVTLMKPVRKHLTYVLLVALPFSSWAGLAASCVQDSQPLPIQASFVDVAHAHHANGQPDSVAQDDESAPIECACCGDCASMCPASSCNPAAISSQALEISIAGHRRANALPDLFHASPAPQRLFRPPIAIS